MQINSQGERMKEIEIFGIPALFSSNRIAPEDVYPGMYRYPQTSCSDDPGYHRCIVHYFLDHEFYAGQSRTTDSG